MEVEEEEGAAAKRAALSAAPSQCCRLQRNVTYGVVFSSLRSRGSPFIATGRHNTNPVPDVRLSRIVDESSIIIATQKKTAAATTTGKDQVLPLKNTSDSDRLSENEIKSDDIG